MLTKGIWRQFYKLLKCLIFNFNLSRQNIEKCNLNSKVPRKSVLQHLADCNKTIIIKHNCTADFDREKLYEISVKIGAQLHLARKFKVNKICNTSTYWKTELIKNYGTRGIQKTYRHAINTWILERPSNKNITILNFAQRHLLKLLWTQKFEYIQDTLCVVYAV